MAAHKEQDESIVLIRLNPKGFRLYCLILMDGHSALPPATCDLAPDVIGQPARGYLNEPGAGIVGEAFVGPVKGRRDERLLDSVLGGGEIAETPDDRAEHLRREIAQQMLGDFGLRGHSMSSGGPLITCRTSIGMFSGAPPGPGAAEASAAIW